MTKDIPINVPIKVRVKIPKDITLMSEQFIMQEAQKQAASLLRSQSGKISHDIAVQICRDMLIERDKRKAPIKGL